MWFSVPRRSSGPHRARPRSRSCRAPNQAAGNREPPIARQIPGRSLVTHDPFPGGGHTTLAAFDHTGIIGHRRDAADHMQGSRKLSLSKAGASTGLASLQVSGRADEPATPGKPRGRRWPPPPGRPPRPPCLTGQRTRWLSPGSHGDTAAHATRTTGDRRAAPTPHAKTPVARAVPPDRAVGAIPRASAGLDPMPGS